MSQPATVQEMPNKAPLLANQAVIRGRVIEVKRTENGHFTAVMLPAPDSYTKPQAVEIRSKHLLGRPQEDVTCRVLVGGYRRSYKDKMNETQYATNITLQAIED